MTTKLIIGALAAYIVYTQFVAPRVSPISSAAGKIDKIIGSSDSWWSRIGEGLGGLARGLFGDSTRPGKSSSAGLGDGLMEPSW